MSADDLFGPETEEELREAEGHPLMNMLDQVPEYYGDPEQTFREYQRRYGGT